MGTGAISSWGDRRKARIGLLGGSFNPAHDGHRHISLDALKGLGLDEVWWLVSPQNPLKPVAGMAPLADRVDAARRVAPHGVKVLDIERRLSVRYTVDTLNALKVRFPQVRFVWLMGADNLVQIPLWRRWRAIFRSVPVAVFDRAPYSNRALSSKAARYFTRYRLPLQAAHTLADQKAPAWVFLPIRRHPASSTEIRERRTKFFNGR